MNPTSHEEMIEAKTILKDVKKRLKELDRYSDGFKKSLGKTFVQEVKDATIKINEAEQKVKNLKKIQDNANKEYADRLNQVFCFGKYSKQKDSLNPNSMFKVDLVSKKWSLHIFNRLVLKGDIKHEDFESLVMEIQAQEQERASSWLKKVERISVSTKHNKVCADTCPFLKISEEQRFAQVCYGHNDFGYEHVEQLKTYCELSLDENLNLPIHLIPSRSTEHTQPSQFMNRSELCKESTKWLNKMRNKSHDI